jgi:hypothetical protein
MRTILITIILILNSHSPALSDVTFEGANNEIVILTGSIETEELDEMLEVMKTKKPNQMILDTYGGNIRSAERLAQYIYENNISTYVSEVAVCKSACVILFLAGKKRLCEGELGVHQARPSKEMEYDVMISKVAYKYLQKDMGELITLLNSFNTPSFVYEQMFKSYDMYNFSKEEIAQINTVKSLDEM